MQGINVVLKESHSTPGIYKITNTLNNKAYIGQSQNLYKRMLQHRKLATYYINNPSANIEGCRRLYAAFRKYKIDNFTFHVVEFCSKDELNQREQFWLDFYESYKRERGYNILPKARSFRGFKLSDERKRALSEKAKTRVGDKNPFYKKTHSKEARKAMSLKRKGRKRGPLEIERFIKSMKGKNGKSILQYDLEGNFIKQWETITSASTELKINNGSLVEHLKGKQQTCGGYIFFYYQKDYSLKIDVNLTSLSKAKYLKILQVSLDNELIRVWNSVREIYRETKFDRGKIYHCLKGKREEAFGFKWEYKL